ncbi:MAG: WD40/YVTN/BNR-like repeat-containing protein [Eubacteriales bacterium]
MRIKFVTALLLLCCLALYGCRQTDEKNEETEPETNQTAETVQSGEESDDNSNDNPTAAEETALNESGNDDLTAVLPAVTFALRNIDMEELPDTVELNADLSDAIAKAISEDFPDLSLIVRVRYLQCWEEDGATRVDAECEIYLCDEKGTDEVGTFEATKLMGSTYIGLAYTPKEGYSHAEPSITDTDAVSDIIRNLSEYKNNPMTEESTLYLDSENRVWIRTPDGDIKTELFYKENINAINNHIVWCMEGDTVIVCGMESSYFDEEMKIGVSRDGGKSWNTMTPELEPIGINAEKGFSRCIIQLMDDGRAYIFLGTNLASLTVLTIAPDTDAADVLYREQIAGYETTALTEAAMVSQNRGFCTLSHPKYAGSNGIYRTTDGGESWIRCYVPLPDEVEDPWNMQLHLPYQTEEGATWYMKGEWGSGECLYVSEDGGWTWNITE